MEKMDTTKKSKSKGKMPVKAKVLIGVGVVLAAALVGFGIWKMAGDGAADGENVLYADSVGMLTGTGLGTQNRFSGVVEAQDTLKINLTSGQTVKEIFVEKGQTVEVGTPLFAYDTDEISMNLEQANLELERIANSISNLNSQIAALNTEKASAPSSEQLSYTTQIQGLQTNVKQEEYNYKVKQMEIERIKKSLASATVNSTIGGVVQEINENPGMDGYTGEQQAFMTILATGKYRVKGTISEQNMGNLFPGMQVIVHSRVDEDLVWSGMVDSIDTEKPESSNQSMFYGSSDSTMQASKYPFYVTLDSSDGLMLGQHVYIEPNMGQDSEDNGMWLMSGYIVDPKGSPYVWAAGKDDKLEKRQIKVGGYDEEMDTYEILDGLKPTDYIVWPSEDCRKGVTVHKNDGSMPIGGMDGSDDMGGMEGSGDMGGMDGAGDGVDMGGSGGTDDFGEGGEMGGSDGGVMPLDGMENSVVPEGMEHGDIPEGDVSDGAQPAGTEDGNAAGTEGGL